ncbi:nuclear transport factor 2 family protein [Kribbella sp. NPDC005582]|uniref:ester cyclase n=1 Tax=Kribbella sp. NPDC005582 TaxID=3156893 RepID=UPI0033A49BDD
MHEFYERYLRRCNSYRFDDLDEFVADDVEINGGLAGLEKYGAGLRSVVETYPDFHWELHRLLVDGDWMSAHLFDTYTTVDGRPAVLQEFALYRLRGGRIVQVWGDLDPDRLANR